MTTLVQTWARWFRWLEAAGRRPASREALGPVLLLAAAGCVGWLAMQVGAAGQVVLGGLVVLALAVLLRGGRLKLFGPVLRYELACTARRGRFILVRTAYAAVLFFALWALYFNFTMGANGFGIPQPLDLARFAEAAFYTFMVVQGAAVFLLTPAYTAGVIAGARERRTLEFLLATDLRDREIVLGGLLVRLANLGLLILTGLPVLSLVQLWGGVDPNLLLAGFAATALSVLSLAAAGALASVYVRRSRDAIVLTYLAAVLYLGLSGLVFLVNDPRVTTCVLASWPGEVTVQDAIDWLNAGNLPVALVRLQEALDVGTPLAEVLPGLLRDYAVFHLLVAAGCSAWAVARLRALALRHLSGAGTEIKGRLRRRPPVRRRPMVWKELWVEPGLSFNRFGKVVIALIALASFVPAAWFVVENVFDFGILYRSAGRGGSGPLDVVVNEWVRVVGTLVASLTLLGVAVRAAGSVTGERERQTLDGLLTSPLESRTVLFAKWLGSILSVRWAWLWLCLVWALGLATGALDPAGVPWFLFCWFVYAAFLAALGLWFSVACPTTLRATLWTVGIAALVGGGHLLVWFTCLLPLSPVGKGLGIDLFHVVFTFELFGLTPPAALSWFAFHTQGMDLGTLVDRQGDVGEQFVFIVLGLLFWASAAGFLAVRTGRRFRVLANRTARPQPAAPPPLSAAADGITTPANTTRARFRSWRQRIAWGAAALLPALALAWWIECTSSASRHLREAIAEADRLDPGWRLEDLEAGREVIPVEHNAAVQTLAAASLITRVPFTPNRDRQLREFEALFKDLNPERQLTAGQVAALTEKLEADEEALIEARRLKDLPKGRYAIAWSSDHWSTGLPHVDKLRPLRSLLSYDAMLDAQQHEEGDGALASCRALLNLGRSLGDEPLIISQLVRLSARTEALKQLERVLAQTQPSGGALADVQRLLVEEEKTPFLLIALRGERAGLDRFMQWAQNNNMSLIKLLRAFADPDARALPPADKFRLLLPGALEEERAAVLEFMNRSVECAKQNPEQQHEALADYDARLNEQSSLARLVTPSIRPFHALVRSKAALRCAIVMVALERYRRARGEWPNDPDTLVKAGFLDCWPADPYDGKPLRLKRLPDGVVIYSIGPDGEDNDGELDRTGHPAKQGTDVGFRLWDVDRRRQPPN